MTMLAKIEDLRREALQEVSASEPMAALLALDDAVVQLGGGRLVPLTFRVEPLKKEHDAMANGVRPEIVTRVRIRQRPSQADISEAVLRSNGEPMSVGRFMDAAVRAGAVIGGTDPLANFRSVLSKDKRFYSLMRDGSYFWWLEGAPLPLKWNEAPLDDFESLMSDASSHNTSQEGGGGHEANNTP